MKRRHIREKVSRKIDPSDNPQRYIALIEARQIVPLSPATFWRLISEGKLQRYRAGKNRVLVRLGDVLDLVRPD
jgi:hypothetical protein